MLKSTKKQETGNVIMKMSEMSEKSRKILIKCLLLKHYYSVTSKVDATAAPPPPLYIFGQ